MPRSARRCCPRSSTSGEWVSGEVAVYGDDRAGLSAIAARSKRLLAEDERQQEPMRPQDGRERTQPSREDQAVRRRLRRAQRPAQPRTGTAPKDDRFRGVGLKQDDDGWYVTTHRARSKSYATPDDIPQKDVDFIESTGALHVSSTRYSEGAADQPFIDTHDCHVGSQRTADHHSVDTHTCRVGGPHYATVLNTSWERVNPGDMIRTPQGQTVKITGRPRPHETDNTRVYVPTEWGMTLMNRGAPVQLVPHNTMQQEQPDSGSPLGGGNVGFQPEKARSHPDEGEHKCPNDGSPLQFTGEAWVCPRGDYSEPTNTPGGATFSNPRNVVQTPQRGSVPRTHIWGSRYTPDGRSAIARRAQQVLELEGNA